MYVDANGNGYQSYEQACIIHGIETPAQLKAEDDWLEAESIKKALDDMEGWGGPAYSVPASPDDPF
jgi:hypothetical protein